MTLIIGAKCNDGLILAADRKILRGDEPDYADKIFELEGVVLAFEGLTGMRDDFLLLLQDEIDRTRGFNSLYEAKLIVEDIIANLSNRYSERLGEDAGLGALLGGLSGITSGESEIYYVHPEGYAEKIIYQCSGHGGEYAHSIAKFLLNQDIAVNEAAKRAAFVVSWVGDDLDTTVGGTPQVAIIRDHVPQVTYLDESTLLQTKAYAREIKSTLPELFKLDDF